MATPGTPAPIAPDDADQRFALLEIDPPATPARPAPAPTPSAAPAPTPTALESARALLTAATTKAAFEAAVAQLVKQYPDMNNPIRVALRPLYRERAAAFEAPAPQTVLPAPRAPRLGAFVKVAGEWRGWIPDDAQHPGAVRPGDRVVLVRRNGAEQTYSVVRVISSAHMAGNPVRSGALIEFGPAGSAPTQVAQELTAPDGMALDPVTSQPLPLVIGPSSSGTLAQALGGISEEGTTNAATQASGSLAGGTMAGVGFTSAAGYVQALANGVKRATADGYLTTLRAHYGYSQAQLNALTVTIIPEASALPEGPGIQHGPANSDAGIAAIRAARQHPRTAHARQVAQELRSEVRNTLQRGALIAGLMTERSLLQWQWVGGGGTTRGSVVAALATIGCEDLAPPAPSALHYAGDAVDSMRNRELDTTRLPSKDLPDGIEARWLIGRKLTGEQISAGDAYGRALLVVSLRDDNTLAFEGDATIAASVRTRYDADTAHLTLRSDVLTAWLSKVLTQRFYGVKRGASWYIPAALREEARALCTVISPLWGDHETLVVTDETDVARLLANGIRERIAKFAEDVEAAIADAMGRARTKATKDGTDPEIAARRATLTTDTAARLVKHGADTQAALDGYSGVLDSSTATVLRGQLTQAQRRLADYGADASTQRAAMLELE